jgi:hypothetical protein
VFAFRGRRAGTKFDEEMTNEMVRNETIRNETINGDDMRIGAIGRIRWAIAEGYIPSQSSFTDRALAASEIALCPMPATRRDQHCFVNRGGTLG